MSGPADTSGRSRLAGALRADAVPTALVAFGLLAFALLISVPAVWEGALRALFPEARNVVHPRGTLAGFTLEHLTIVGISSAITIVIGVPLGIFVTRAAGRRFRPLVASAVDLGQTFPPVAVLALAMPLLGFGYEPAIVALVIYGLFPVVSGTVAGIEAVPAAVRDAAVGMGMTPLQVLTRVELPLAARVIMGGIRTSVSINIGTATVGAAIGTGGLGVPIIAGLAVQNMAYVLEGAVPAAMLAVLADAALARIEHGLTYARTAQ